MVVFSNKKTKIIFTVILFLLSLSVPIGFTIFNAGYSIENTKEDKGTIVSIEGYEHYLKGRSKIVVDILDNGNRYYIPGALHPYVDSFDFQKVGSKVVLRYDERVNRHDAYMIVAVSDEQTDYLSLENTNRYERLSRILVWVMYVAITVLLLGAAWCHEISLAIKAHKREKKHRQNVERKNKKREQINNRQ